MSNRKVILNLSTIILSVVLTVIVLEVVIRGFRPQKFFAASVNTWDRVLGTKHIPGGRGFMKCEAFDFELAVNSKGLRDREFAYGKRDGTKRVLCLGGSFTCGYGVAAQEAFPKVLERLLNSDEDESVAWEVLNAGVGSTGTTHQHAFFEYEGYKYEPDVVLLCFSQGTDFWDNITSGLYTFEGGALIKHDAPKTRWRMIQNLVGWVPGYNTFFARSHLLNFIKARVSRYHYRDLAKRSEIPKDQSAIQEVEDDLTRALLCSLNDKCRAMDCRLVLTAIPHPGTFEYRPDMLSLLDYLDSLGVAFIDLAPAFREADGCGVEISFFGDRHWTPEGHEIAGQEIYSFFVDRMDEEILDT